MRRGLERRESHQALQDRHDPVANAAQVYSQKVVPFNFIGTEHDLWLLRANAPRPHHGWNRRDFRTTFDRDSPVGARRAVTKTGPKIAQSFPTTLL